MIFFLVALSIVISVAALVRAHQNGPRDIAQTCSCTHVGSPLPELYLSVHDEPNVNDYEEIDYSTEEPEYEIQVEPLEEEHLVTCGVCGLMAGPKFSTEIGLEMPFLDDSIAVTVHICESCLPVA